MTLFRDIKKSVEKRNIDLKQFDISNESESNIKQPAETHTLNIREKKRTITYERKQLSDVKRKRGQHQGEQKLIIPESGTTKTKKRTELIIFPVLMGVAIVALINVLAVVGQGQNLASSITSSAYAGYEKLFQGTKDFANSDYVAAQKSFIESQNIFDTTLQTAWFLQSKSSIANGQDENIARTVSSLLETGKLLAQAAEYFPSLGQDMQKLVDTFIIQNKALNLERREQSKFITDLNAFFEKNQKVLHLVVKAQQVAREMNVRFVPDEQKKYVETLRKGIDTIVTFVSAIDKHRAAILEMMGETHPHRYLVLLQNNAETRPTGGFIGSYLLVEVNQGFVTDISFEDVYARDGQMTEVIEPPEEIKKLTKGWYLRDSNYWPDFALSGAQAAWFLEKEKGPAVDTVIAANQTILDDLLQISGPIEIPGLSAPIEAGSASTVLQYVVEAKITGEQEPKKIFKSLIPELQKRLLSKENAPKFVNVLMKEAMQKNLMMYSKYDAVEALFQDLDVTGTLHTIAPKEDYLNVTVINVGGNKSDKYIEQDLTHETVIGTDGTVTDQLSIIRKHTWSMSSQRDIRRVLQKQGWDQIPDLMYDILGRGRNSVVMRVYVPKGAKLIGTEGIPAEIVQLKYDEKLDKNYFLFDMAVSPNEEKEIVLRYALPFTLDLAPVDTYKLYVETQPGFISPVHLTKRTVGEHLIQPLKFFPETTKKDDTNRLIYDEDLTTDIYMSAVWKK